MDNIDRPSPILSPPEIDALLRQASAAEREVLVKRFGLDQDHYRTLQQTSEAVGRSVGEVRALEEDAVSRFTQTTTEAAVTPARAAVLPLG